MRLPGLLKWAIGHGTDGAFKSPDFRSDMHAGLFWHQWYLWIIVGPTWDINIFYHQVKNKHYHSSSFTTKKMYCWTLLHFPVHQQRQLWPSSNVGHSRYSQFADPRRRYVRAFFFKSNLWVGWKRQTVFPWLPRRGWAGLARRTHHHRRPVQGYVCVFVWNKWELSYWLLRTMTSPLWRRQISKSPKPWWLI